MPPPAARRQPIPPPLAAIVGPTASGKTDLALALAQRLPVEILVADSRQVYRGMDIGTAKPDAAARAAVPHHLLDLVDPDAAFTRGRLGRAGTAAGARDLGPRPAAAGGRRNRPVRQRPGRRPRPRVAARLSRAAPRAGRPSWKRKGCPSWPRGWRRVDPAAAARTDLRNPRRVLRALERAIAGGGASTTAGQRIRGRVAWRCSASSRPPAGAGRADRGAQRPGCSPTACWTRCVRCAARGYGPDLPALSGHGYREALAVLAGELSLERRGGHHHPPHAPVRQAPDDLVPSRSRASSGWTRATARRPISPSRQPSWSVA